MRLSPCPLSARSRRPEHAATRVRADPPRGGGTVIIAADAAAPQSGDPGGVKVVVNIERSARRGRMAPLHRRDEDETYRVIEGEMTFFVDGRTIAAGPGDEVVAPAGAPR